MKRVSKIILLCVVFLLSLSMQAQSQEVALDEGYQNLLNMQGAINERLVNALNEIKALRQKVEDKEKIIKSLVAAQDIAKQPLERQMQTLQAKIDRLTEELSEREKTIVFLVEKGDGLTKRLEESLKENAVNKRRLVVFEKNEKELKSLRKDKKRLTAELDEQRQRIIRLEKEISGFGDKLKNAQDLVPLKVEETKKEYNQKIDEINKSIPDQIEQAKQPLIQEMDLLKARLADSEERVIQERVKFNEQKKEKDDLKLELTEVTEKEKQMSSEKIDLSNQIKVSQSEIGKRDLQIQELNKGNSQLNIEISNLKEALNLSRDSAAQLNKQLDEAKKQLDQEVNAVPNKLSEARAPLQAEIDSLKKQLKEAKDGFPAKMGKQKAPLLEKINLLEKRLVQNSLEAEGQRLELQELREKYNEDTKELAGSRKKIENLNSSLAKLQDELDTVLAQYKGEVSAVNRFEQKEKQYQKDINLLKRDKSALESELFSMHDEMDQMEVYFEEQLKKLVVPLEERVKQDEQTLKLSDIAIKQGEMKIKELENENEVLKRQLIKNEQDIMLLQRQVDSLNP